MAVFKYSPVDLFFTCLGLLFLLLDIGLDVFAAVSFYQEKAYASLGILLLFLTGSSVLVQAYSWLWYSYEDFNRVTKAERCLSKSQLMFLHFLQLGIYFRHAGVMEMSIGSVFSNVQDPDGMAVYLSHDLSMLRLIETFSESSPQFVLMLAIILQRGELGLVTVLKAIGSASAIAFSVTTYHRSLRSFLPDKEKQHVTSSVVYFLWNLLLISSRLTALALFASVLPCFIFTHFLCSWVVLFFFVWRAKTDFMESAAGEWLYRATVGLIWYFTWFNVVEGRTRNRSLFYHGYILVDITLLCGLWSWKMSTEPSYFEIPLVYAMTTIVGVVAVYSLGLLFKIIYYKCYHPNLGKDELMGDTGEKYETGKGPTGSKALHEDVVDFAGSPPEVQVICMRADLDTDVTDRSWTSPPPPTAARCNKRMRKLAENFYS